MRDCLEAGVDTIEPDMVEHFLHNPNALRGYTAVVPTLLAGGALHDHPFEDTPANRIVMANSRHVAEGSENAMRTAVEQGIPWPSAPTPPCPSAPPIIHIWNWSRCRR